MRPPTAEPSARPGDAALAERYRAALRSAAAAPRPAAATADCSLLMVRGLFGSWIPRHFRAPLRHFEALGWQVGIGRTAAGGTLAQNAMMLGGQIDRLIAAGRRPLLLAHSKGGLEVLMALADSPARVRAIAGMIGVQVPRGGAPYLEHLFASTDDRDRGQPLRLGEWAEETLLGALGARAACMELTTPNLGVLARRLDAIVRSVPSLMVATSAQRMSNVLELRSAHLELSHPGQPHDGVFLTADQIWPEARMLQLDGIDHAQPSVGGLGFAHEAFWAALLATLLD